ncbi:MAG: hypothetical protein EPN91_06900 [Salinibacterium sp.]|nr:MAG: hypothetical protein EPN91_06900 [Salinibacterium sp.]
MRTRLIPMGTARIARDPDTGEIIVDDRSLRRNTARNDDFGDDDFGDDDFGDDDFGDEYGDDEYDADVEAGESDMGDDDFGGPRRRGKRRARKAARKQRRKHRSQGGGAASDYTNWGKTIVGGSFSGGAGTAQVRVRLQFDFRALDIAFNGSTAATVITLVQFGDRIVFQDPDGFDVSLFASTGFIRNLVNGQSLRAGLDILVVGILPGAGSTLRVAIPGRKPVMAYC